LEDVRNLEREGQLLARWYLYALILLSGAAGLVYEVVWARQLTLFIGNTAVANAAVLTAFMTGLALGSLALGRKADVVKSPLLLYAVLEVLIGCYGATTPWLFDLLQLGYARAAGIVGVTGAYSHLPRFAVAVLAMLVPTFLMGGTLPLLIRHFSRDLAATQLVTSRIYGINTLGATLGAFSAGFVLLPALGITDTLLAAAAVNLLVGGGVYFALRRASIARAGSPDPGQISSLAVEPGVLQRPMLLLVGFGISGFAALLYQVLWIHALVLVIGISVYAFSTVLTVYLAGIGLGSLLIGRLFGTRTIGKALKIAFYLQLGIALTAVTSLSLVSYLPILFVQGWQKLHDSFPLFQSFMFGLSGMVIFIPTLLLGALFPLVTAIWSQCRGKVGRGVGEAYGANALGTIAGSAIGGLFILDWLGLEHSLFLASALSAAVAVLFWFLSSSGEKFTNRWWPLPLSAALLAGLIFLLPGFNKSMLQAEVFRHAGRFVGTDIAAQIQAYLNRLSFLYYKEGIHGTVSVIGWHEGKQLRKALMTNGKVDASTDTDMITQIMLAQVPLFLHPNPKDVMVIGLGSGVTAGAALQTPSVEKLDVLEISPDVVEAADLFSEENHDVLNDARTELVVADARNFLLASDQTYDVIISEPSHSWVTGVSNLFTRDFLELVRSRLNENGLLAQWYHIYGVNRESLKALLKAVSDVFPYYTLWYMLGGDLIIVSSDHPLALDYSAQSDYMANESVRSELQRVGIDSVEEMMAQMMMTSEQVEGLLEGQESNTDDRPIVEFTAPKYLYNFTTEDNIRMLFGELTTGEVRLPVSGLTRLAGDWLDVPFMGIRVLDESRESPDPNWNVVRTSIYSGRSESYRLMGGMNGDITLHKPWGELVVHSTIARRGTPDKTVLYPMMNQDLPQADIAQAGELKGGDLTIYWRVGAGEKNGSIKVVLGRVCKQPSGTDNYLLLTSSYPGNPEVRADIARAVQTVNAQLRCLDGQG